VNNQDSACGITGIAVGEDIVYAALGDVGIHVFDFTDLNDIRYTGKLKSNGISVFNTDSLPLQQPESSTPAEKQEDKADKKIAYITIDDGPSRNNTPKNLDTLRKYGVKATFFVLPRKHLDDIYRRILDEGHVIGNHSYVHDYKYLFGPVDNFRNDVLEAQNFIYERFQYKSTVYRFPGGTMGRSKSEIGERSKILGELGYKYFDWNVTTADTDPNLKKIGNEGQIVDKLANNVINGANGRNKLIILMHDSVGKGYTAKALPKIIEGLQKQGYTFDVLTNY
jgi:peptidoglycan/xylan/chitin deacetylase (PgdA/CDA1 family)